MSDKKYKISVLIPARQGSKRIPNKNIQPINGIPLIVYSITAGMALEPLKTYVSSDSEEYLKIAKKYGAIPILRDKKLCQDDTPMEEVITDFLSKTECDLVVQLLPTTPFRSIPMLKKSIQTLLDAGDNAESLRSVEEMPESAFKCYEVNYGYLKSILSICNYSDKCQSLHNISYQTHPTALDSQGLQAMALSNLPNQYFTTTYRANGYVDIFKRDRILNGDSWGRCIAFVTPPVIEIDTPEQLRYANYVAISRSYDVCRFERSRDGTG